MKCLRSGYCCFNYDVIIIDDPKVGPILGNLKHKPSGERCQHIRGDKSGEFSCAIHNYKWYEETPCSQFTQMEYNSKNLCRVGEYLKEHKVNPKSKLWWEKD